VQIIYRIVYAKQMCLETGPEDSHRRCGSDMFRQTGNLVPMGEEIPLERGHQRGVPPAVEIVILPLLAHLA